MLSLTFGVEIEFVFAIERFESFTDDKQSVVEPSILRQALAHDASMGLDIGTRLSNIFERANLALNSLNQDSVGYTHWDLVQEYSVDVLDVELHVALSDRIRSADDALHWGRYPMELVSRVLPAPDSPCHPSVTELKTYLSTFRGPSSPDTPYGAYVTPFCGLHVHIGTSTGPLPLPVLRHLAYLTAIFEPVIMLLHPDSRPHSQWCQSNLEAFSRSPHTCPSRRSLKSPREIHGEIFAPELTSVDLGILMSIDRYRIVNWAGITDPQTRKPTLEFRQHDGCLDPDEITMWVRLITELARTAERFAEVEAEADVDADVYRDILTSNKWPDLSTTESIHSAAAQFFRLLTLPLLERRHWHARLRENLFEDQFIIQSPSETCDGCRMDIGARDTRRHDKSMALRSLWGWNSVEGSTVEIPEALKRRREVGRTKSGRDKKKAKKLAEMKRRAKLRKWLKEMRPEAREDEKLESEAQQGWERYSDPKSEQNQGWDSAAPPDWEPTPELLSESEDAPKLSWGDESDVEMEPETEFVSRLQTEMWASKHAAEWPCEQEAEWASEIRW